jgi:hypothetical protein
VASAISHAYGRAKSVGNAQKNPEKAHRALARVAGNPDAWAGRAMADHVPYGLYARYLPPDTQYLTFLRDPVERVLSHYYFHANAGPNKVRNAWRRLAGPNGVTLEVGDEDDVSLEAGLERGLSIYNNFATRFIWGGETLDEDLPTDALEQATQNLAGFAFVGVTERLDEAVILLARMLDVPIAGYHMRHVREGRPTAADVPDDLRRLIEEHNALDIALYRVARDRFDAQAAAAGDLRAEVEDLTLQRGEVTDVAEARRTARKTAGRERRSAEGRPRRGAGGVDALRSELEALGDRIAAIEAALGIEPPRPADPSQSTKQQKGSGRRRFKREWPQENPPPGESLKLQRKREREDSPEAVE